MVDKHYITFTLMLKGDIVADSTIMLYKYNRWIAITESHRVANYLNAHRHTTLYMAKRKKKVGSGKDRRTQYRFYYIPSIRSETFLLDCFKEINNHEDIPN